MFPRPGRDGVLVRPVQIHLDCTLTSRMAGRSLSVRQRGAYVILGAHHLRCGQESPVDELCVTAGTGAERGF
jgi:hypothetical protein